MKMDKAIPFVLIVVGILTLVVRGAEEPEGIFELKCHKVEDWDQTHIRRAAQRAKRLPRKPPKLKGLPKDLSDELLYFAAELGREKTVIVLDCANHKLCVDFNCDLDLSEKELLGGRRVKPGRVSSRPAESEVYVFGPAYLKLWEETRPQDSNATEKNREDGNAGGEQGQDEQDGHGIWFYVEVCDNRRVTLYLGTCSTGEVRVGKDRYQLAVLDKNFDGIYSTLPVSKLLKHDMIAVDLNKDGLFRGSREFYSLRDRLRIKGRYYDLAVAFDGSGIILQEPLIFVPPVPVMPGRWARGPMALAPRVRGIPRVALKKCRAGG